MIVMTSFSNSSQSYINNMSEAFSGGDIPRTEFQWSKKGESLSSSINQSIDQKIISNSPSRLQ